MLFLGHVEGSEKHDTSKLMMFKVYEAFDRMVSSPAHYRPKARCLKSFAKTRYDLFLVLFLLTEDGK